MKKFISLIFILFILYLSYFIFHSSLAYAIEVGGHLTEDTTWSPDNNPYLVTSGIYVDAGVTLTILPGTIVKFNSAYYDDLSDDQFYFHNGEEPIAKFIRVEGRIIAEGTEQDSIIFTRMQDEQYYHWGAIYLPEGAETSSFKHCVFEYAAVTGFSLSEQVRAAIAIWNGSAIIEECSFIDNDKAVSIERNIIKISIINSYFDYVEFPHPNITTVSGTRFILIRHISNVDTGVPLIADNIFNNGSAISSYNSICFIYNTIDSVPYDRDGMYLSDSPKGNYIYNNEFGSCDKGIFSLSSGKVFNNILSNARLCASSYLEVFNNIGFGGDTGIIVTYRNESNTSNLSINNQYAFGGYFNGYYNNCIILGNEELTQYGVSGNPIFRNCIIDFPLDYPLIDGGGNIIVDSLQAQSIFVDIQNGDFHLIEGSLAIDAGFDTLGYYYPFDMDYKHRVWDGDNNGTVIIDIGPYEFGSPAFGGIEGYTYNPTTGDPVDYVLLKINNQPGEFTFTDSIGNFEYKLPAGIYDVYAERVFYEDVVEYQIEVIDGEFTQIAIPMFEIVDAAEQTIPNPSSQISNLMNYPNPFNPTTTISFSLPEDGDVELSIYNVKGQKVKDLSPSLYHAELVEVRGKTRYSVVWNGTNENNQPVSSGVYLCKIKAGDQESVKRMLLLK